MSATSELAFSTGYPAERNKKYIFIFSNIPIFLAFKPNASLLDTAITTGASSLTGLLGH
jgi:hypothetical protein